MIILWLLLIANIKGQEANRTDDNDGFEVLNVTTLYPVSKVIKKASSYTAKTAEGRTTWNLETTYAETHSEKNLDYIREEKENNVTTSEEEIKEFNNIIAANEETKGTNNNATILKEEVREINNNVTVAEEDASRIKACKDFKPSQHLGSFLDEELTKSYDANGPVQNPGYKFERIHKKEHNSIFNPSPEDNQSPQEFPYKFDDTIYRTKDVWTHDTLQPRPTVGIPVRVPAGGLYKLEDPFTVHPSIFHSGLNEEYGLEIKENLRKNYIKKRTDPWKKLLRLVTALVPAGLIISALTPSVISVHSAGPEARFRTRFVRRSDDSGFELPTISEQCRRRLLCELHSEGNYKKSQSDRRIITNCYKIQCEDPQAVWRILHWLLKYHQPRPNDERGRYLT